jgi:hypothetical protein
MNNNLFNMAGIITAAASTAALVYNNNRSIQSSERIQELDRLSREALQRDQMVIQERIEMAKLELEKARLGLLPRQDLNLVNSTLNDQEVSESTRRAIEAVKYTNEGCVIASPFESGLPDLVNNTLLQNTGFVVVCYSLVTLNAAIGLGLNLVIRHYGKEKIQKLPKWCQTLFRVYGGFSNVSVLFQLGFIIFSQTLCLLLGLYLFFYGA